MSDAANTQKNVLVCRDCGQHHETAGEALQCDREGWHINYNTGEPCKCEAKS